MYGTITRALGKTCKHRRIWTSSWWTQSLLISSSYVTAESAKSESSKENSVNFCATTESYSSRSVAELVALGASEAHGGSTRSPASVEEALGVSPRLSQTCCEEIQKSEAVEISAIKSASSSQTTNCRSNIFHFCLYVFWSRWLLDFRLSGVNESRAM